MSHLAHSICCTGWDFTLRVTLTYNVAASILHTGLLAKIWQVYLLDFFWQHYKN